MALHELYLGGRRKQNDDFGMFPAATFDETVPFTPFNKEQPITYFQAREFDFVNETALVSYVAANPIATGDTAGAVLVPADFVMLAAYWKVVTPVAAGTFSAATRIGGTALIPNTPTAVADSNFVPLAAPLLFKTPDIMDVTWVAVPASGLAPLNLVVGFVGYHMRYGRW